MIQKPKGTYDVYGKKGKTILEIENILKAVMEKYNYEYVRTPLFEASDLFHRGVGETTDIVTKETYDFIDRGNRNMTLRPEGTAGVVRSFIENKMYGNANLPVKTWYYGPMYRYERPQSGRFREFYQFGVEAFGSDAPLIDAEVISIPVNLYKLLGLKGIKVNINSLGNMESRNKYREALKDYFKPHLNELCDDCKERFEKNPLRIIDCKYDANLDIIKNAPKIIDYLDEMSKNHFDEVQKYLKAMQIDYEINPRIVRGLDYYTHTVFEVEADIKGFGAQNILCGGGRYDSLVETIGGPKMSGIGFALGLERLLSALEFENIDLVSENNIDAYISPMPGFLDYAIYLTNRLRMSGFNIDMDYMNRKLANNFKQADRLGAKFIIIIGEEEFKEKIVTIKNNHDKTEYKVKEEDIVDFLDEKLTDECECEECHHED